MASKLPVVKGAAHTFRAVLFAQSGNQIKTSPTLAAGDFQVSIDGGDFANLATTPSESPASSGQVLVTLSTSETNGDEILVRAIDAAGDEWHSQAWTIHTAAQTFDTTDGIADAVKAKTDNLPADPADDSDIDSQLAAIAAYIDTEVAAILAAVDTEVAAIKAKTDNLPTDPADQSAVEAAITSATSALATSAEIAALNDPTVAAIADAVLDELTAGHTTAGSLSKAIIDVLADTDELQGNQSAWLTADVSALATSAEVGALNDIAAADVWAALGDTEKNAIADAILSRGVDNVEDTASALSLAELVLAAFESAIDGTTWTIYKSDHATAFQTRTVTVDAAADPIVEVAGGN